MKLIGKFDSYILCPLCTLLSLTTVVSIFIFISYQPSEYANSELGFLSQKDSIKNHIKMQVTKEISDLLRVITNIKDVLESDLPFSQEKLDSLPVEQLSASPLHLAHLEGKECFNLFLKNGSLSPYDYLMHAFQEERNIKTYSAGAKNVVKRMITIIPYIQNYFKLSYLIRNPNKMQLFIVSDLNDMMLHYPLTTGEETLDVFTSMNNPPTCKYKHDPSKTPPIYYHNCRDWYLQVKSNQAKGKTTTISNIYKFITSLTSYSICVSTDELIQSEKQRETGQNKMHICIDKIPLGTKEYYEFLISYIKGYFSVVKPLSPSTTLENLQQDPVIPVFYPFFSKFEDILDVIRYEFFDVKEMKATDFSQFEFELHDILTNGPVESSGTYCKEGETMFYKKYPLKFRVGDEEEYLAFVLFHENGNNVELNQQDSFPVAETEHITKLRALIVLGLIIVIFVFLKAFGQDFSASIVKPIIATQNLLSHKKFDEIEGNKAKIIKSKEIEHITSLLVDLHTINKKKLDQWGSKMDFDLFARKTYSQVGNTKLLKSAEEAIGTSLSYKNSFDLATMHFLASYAEDKQEEPTIEKCCFLTRSATQSSNRECDAALQENRGGRGS